MRPLVYEFQDFDFEACSEDSTQFMLGPYMLVANVLQPIKDLRNSPSSQK